MWCNLACWRWFFWWRWRERVLSIKTRSGSIAPGPTLCRPMTIHTRLGAGRCRSQPAPIGTYINQARRRVGRPKRRPVAPGRPALIYNRLDATPGGRSARAPRAGRKLAEAPGRARALQTRGAAEPMGDIQTRLCTGRAESQQHRLALIYTRLDAAPGGPAAAQSARARPRSAEPWRRP